MLSHTGRNVPGRAAAGSRTPAGTQPVGLAGAGVAGTGPQIVTADDVLALQATAGNRATTSALRSAAAAPGTGRAGPAATLQGDWTEENSSPLDPGPLALRPEDPGQPTDTMSWTELQDAIDEQRAFVAEQTSTSPELIRRQGRLATLEAAQQKLAGRVGGAKPAGAGRKGKGRGKRRAKAEPATLPPRPASLSGSIDLAKRSPHEIRSELDLVIAYLAAGPPKAEREVLELELPFLEEAAGVARAEKQAAKRSEKLSAALSPTTGSEADQLTAMLHRVQDAERDPAQEGVWLIHHDGVVFPLTAVELVALRQQVAGGLAKGAAAVNGVLFDVKQAWQDRHDTNQRHKVVHRLAKFTSGTEDISPKEIERMVAAGDFYARRVRERGRAGALVLAGDDLLVFDGFARHWAGKVGEWESELMGGAGRWVIALTIVKESLGLLAGFGAAGLAAKAGGGFMGAMKAGATVASLTTATGAVAGGVGAAVTGNDVLAGVRSGGGAGFGVGANALTAGVGRLGSMADVAKAGTTGAKALAVGKALALDAGGNVAAGVTQAAIEGGDMGKAALGALVTSPIGTLGGGAVDRFATGRAAAAIGKTVVGGTAGATGAVATGGDVLTGALVGGGGGLYGSLATPIPTAATAGATGDIAAADVTARAGATPAAVAPATPTQAGLDPRALLQAPVTVTAGGGPAAATGAGPAAAVPAGAAPSASGGPLFAAGDLDAHFANLGEGDLAGHNPNGANQYSVDANALTGARFSREGGSELDLRGIADVTVQDGAAPLQAGDPAQPVRQAGLPPETWLLDPARTGMTDPAQIADTQFRPNRAGRDYDVRNAQVVAGPAGDKVTTPTGPDFGEDRVVGGARGATLDPLTGTWQPGAAPYERPHNPLGQGGAFAPRTPDEWHAWEQAHGPLTDEQRYALWFYSDDLSGHLNPALRGGHAGEFVTDPAALAAAASDLDQTMQPVPFDATVHRKASIEDFADLGISDVSQLAAMKGSSYGHQGYTSTAVVPGKWSGDIDVVIQVPKGTRGRYLAGAPGADPANPTRPTAGAPLASMPSEMEFLIERGTTFTVQDARQDPSTGRWTVEVRVAEQGVKPGPLTSPVPLPGVAATP